MKIDRIIKLAPIVLAFAILVPVGAMAADNPGVYSGTDYSTLFGSSATWTDHIDQYLSNVQTGAPFQFHNEFHNANGGNTVEHPVLDVFTYGLPDTYNLPDLGPCSYTSNFLYTTSHAVADSQYSTVQVTHIYSVSGASIRNQDQTYYGV